MKKKVKNLDYTVLKIIGKILLFIIKIPYYLIRGICHLLKKTKEEINENRIKRKRYSIKPIYQEFKIIESEKGDYKKWADEVFDSESKIGIIIGARGTGKTAFGIKILENIYSKNKRKCFAMGFDEDSMPSWIKVVPDTSKLENDSFVLVDEGGILFSSRNAMTNINKILSDLILIARHKNLSILFISQNSSNLDVNILRQADFLIFKPSSLLQKEFERKIIQKIYDLINEKMSRYKNIKGITYIYSDRFRGFVANPLPSFWGIKISKSFRNDDIEKLNH